ncbi:universal stress protein [Ramlibacter alkalitolerans]|uniref:Universal stress protein n=1 Tax=Ramlibacter alkalitolerans TaxID=2039631 RepID=A0ABS1JT86_9BURK|nr:universal stress protein [Ramlibacter alkalitolerans]MBL0427489.1 universal stress protein [Ramlibacter alkalitolerans]
MNIKSILVVTDLSARENVAVQRAWQLADTHRASVRLMYVPPHGQKALPAAASRLANAARQLEETMELRVRTAPIESGKLEDLVSQAQGTDLVVLPHRHERSTAAFFRGQPVLRLLRRLQRPVLVVRQARGASYERVLVAVDFSAASEALVKLAAGLATSAELEIFHAISTLDESKLRSAEAPEHAVRAYRERCLQHARERIVSLTDSFDTRRNRVLTAIGRGDPGRQTVIQQEHTGADLVVLGKKRTTAWEDFFCGSVAHRVLSWGTSDVLVVPDGCLSATAPHAARRLASAVGKNTALPVPAAARRMS